MHAEPQVGVRLAQALERRQWQAFGLVAACLLAPLLVFWPTFFEMVRIWNRSETFTHGWLVLPAFLYFVWQRRGRLAATPIRPFYPAVLLAGGIGLVWLLGALSSSLTPSFFAVAALVPAVVLSVLGWGWFRELLFPLAFLFFAVPFGEAFVPQLMEWTADFTVLALQASGVPVLREGQNLMIPSGRWSVVEACSGIRYLIASVFVGALFAWMMYRSLLRRALFFAASIVVPIVANWMRAYIIVMLGHLSDNQIATGVDHLIYGWIFFGVVMALLFWVGSLWREDDATPGTDDKPRPLAGVTSFPIGSGRRVGLAAVATFSILVGFPVAEATMLAPRPRAELAQANVVPVAGWTSVAPAEIRWKPHLENSTSEQRFAFAKDGATVEVFLGFFRDQRQGAELVNSSNQLLPTRDRSFLTVGTTSRTVTLAGRSVTVRAAQISGYEHNVSAWQWYWLGDLSTSSDARAKLELALDRLLGRDDTSVWVTLFTIDAKKPEDADRLLATFVNEMGAALDSAMHRVVPQ